MAKSLRLVSVGHPGLIDRLASVVEGTLSFQVCVVTTTVPVAATDKHNSSLCGRNPSVCYTQLSNLAKNTGNIRYSLLISITGINMLLHICATCAIKLAGFIGHTDLITSERLNLSENKSFLEDVNSNFRPTHTVVFKAVLLLGNYLNCTVTSLSSFLQSN